MTRRVPKVSARGLVRALVVVSVVCVALHLGPLLIGWAVLSIQAALSPPATVWSGPLPRDVSSPEGLSPELARTRIQWGRRYRYLDGTLLFPDRPQDPHWGYLSRSGRYFVGLGTGSDTIEWMDVVTWEQRVLAKTGDFPGALVLGFPSFSPDEQAVVFDVCWPDRCHIAIVDVASGEITYIPLGRTMNDDPIVSPDGRWILVGCESRLPMGFWGLCLIDWETHIRTFLTDDEGLDPVLHGGYHFTPDSQWVVYAAGHGPPTWEGRFFRVSIDGEEKHLLLSGISSATSVRAVTREDVVFSCRFPDEPRCDWVCVMGLDGSDVRRLTYLGKFCLPREDTAEP